MGEIKKLAAPPQQSAQNIQKLIYLIEQFRFRDIGYFGAAELLRCSPARARYYLHMLRDNGVIVTCPRMMAQDSPDKQGFCLNPQAALVGRFVVELGESVRSVAPTGEGVVPGRIARADSTQRSAWRDPLIAALFGPAPNAGL